MGSRQRWRRGAGSAWQGVTAAAGALGQEEEEEEKGPTSLGLPPSSASSWQGGWAR